MRVLVTGATGQFGRAIADAQIPAAMVLRLQGRAAAPPAWAERFEWASADLADGRGVTEAVTGVDAIIHAASDPRRSDAVDVEGTRRLVAAAGSQGVGHLLFVSIASRKAPVQTDAVTAVVRACAAIQVEDGPRWIDEGPIVTSAGISAGIDMSLHLVERLAGEELARRTARQMDYDWRRS